MINDLIEFKKQYIGENKLSNLSQYFQSESILVEISEFCNLVTMIYFPPDKEYILELKNTKIYLWQELRKWHSIEVNKLFQQDNEKLIDMHQRANLIAKNMLLNADIIIEHYKYCECMDNVYTE